MHNVQSTIQMGQTRTLYSRRFTLWKIVTVERLWLTVNALHPRRHRMERRNGHLLLDVARQGRSNPILFVSPLQSLPMLDPHVSWCKTGGRKSRFGQVN
jgi:hypothetical protein